MSKKMKKIFSFLLVVVMTLAINLNVFAFADNNKTVNVNFKMYGETYASETVDIDELKADLNSKGTEHYYSTAPYTNYNTEGIKNPTTADAMIYAYNEYSISNGAETVTPFLDTNYPNTESVISYNWDLMPRKGKPGIYFIYFDGLNTANSNTVANADGTYTWIGDTWTLYVNGQKSELYASNVELEAGMTIDFDYGTVTETWK